MSQTLRQSITELEARAKQYEAAAAQSRQAAQQLRDLLAFDSSTGSPAKATTAPKVKSAPTPAPVKAKAKPVKKAKAKTKATKAGKPTLISAITHVLKTRRDQKAGGVKASQLYDEIHDAGFQFQGTNQKNNMTYLYKVLRQNRTRIAHSEDGLFSLKG
jgi:hypothetical protein